MPRPLSIGVQLPEVERVVTWPELAELSHAIEESGFDSIWVGDHLLYRDGDGERGPWEAWTSLAAIAAITERVHIGPLVAATAFHEPTMLAKMAATVQEISGGRLILGLGAGWNEVEFRAYGLPFDRRASRFKEAFTIIRSLLNEGAIDYSGRYYSADQCVLVPQPAEPPPLMIGSRGPRMLAATLPHVDAWNAWYAWFGNNAEGLEPLLDRIDEACVRAGRDPQEVERTVAVEVSLGDISNERNYNDRYEPWTVQRPDGLADLLRRYADLGIGHVQLVLDPITVESVEALRPVLSDLDHS